MQAGYDDTLAKLDDELDHLDAEQAWLQVVVSGPGMVRKDGQLAQRADVLHPGVVLTIVTPAHGTLVYTCDRFEQRWSGQMPGWQANLRAITLALGDLRRLERYGIADRGQQYAGFRELGSGTAMEGGTHDRRSLARFIATAAGDEDPEALNPDDVAAVESAYRRAARAHHPDHGGNPQMMAYLNAARTALVG